jgi:arylsulfatase A-like enzyme
MLRHRPTYFYGTGVHRMEGIFIAGGDGVRGARTDEPLSLLDLAPTILDGMGVPAPATMTGRSAGPQLWPVAG